jgi:hypothetical protein
MYSIVFLEQIARGGGGGSSSDSGGVGGFAFIGWALMHFPLTFLRRFIDRSILLPISAVVAALISIGLIVSSFTLREFLLTWFAIEAAIGVWIGWGTAMFNVWDKMKKRFKKADADLAAAGWSETDLHQTASQIFLRYQTDWSNRDSSHFAEYLTPYYAAHASMMIRALAELRRYNTMKEPQIVRMDTTSATDSTDDNRDYFSVLIEAKAEDTLFDEVQQKVLHTTKKNFIEEWTFQKQNGNWMLAGIRQSTEDAKQLEADMQQFAVANHMYYSLDMGWLFIPARGQLFNNGKWSFGYSDINNHIIGSYNGRLVQLYTYRRNEDRQNNSTKNFLVGQVNVPKEYGGILIERKKGFINRIFAPKGYQKYEFEWPDFNKRYNVYATDQSRLATFELLNPAFMAFLYDNFNDVNIEVVDNVIYFYAEKLASTPVFYEQHLQLLMKAFKELQL